MVQYWKKIYRNPSCYAWFHSIYDRCMQHEKVVDSANRLKLHLTEALGQTKCSKKIYGEMHQLLTGNTIEQRDVAQKTENARQWKCLVEFFFCIFHASKKECNEGSNKWMKIPLIRMLIENKTTKMINKNILILWLMLFCWLWNIGRKIGLYVFHICLRGLH